MLPSTDDESFVCVLSSMNLTKWDHPDFARAVQVLIYFLDTVIFESIEKLRALREKHKYHFLDRIERFLTRHRALGMGVLGWHHLLQSKMIPFESRDAARLNVEVFKLLKNESYAASKQLAEWFGEPELLKGYGMRNTTTMAIAPTKSSSFILGNVSEGIQPELSNCYLADLAKETVVVKNPYLEKWLESVDKNTADVWESIQLQTGSISHFEWIPQHVKDVFKTFPEINPKAVIDQAAARQPHIDQGQSLNMIFHPDVTAGEINHLFYYAWLMGIKGLYYQIGMSAAQAHNTKKLNMKTCVACES
jgi:ribonucleoside-diphosphate reductase alpha chain